MSQFRWTLIALALTTALFATACSDDGGADDGPGSKDAGTDVTADVQQPLDDAGDDTGEDVGPDTVEQDAGPRETIWLTTFRYFNPKTGSGVSVKVVAGLVGKIENSHELTRNLTEQEVEVLKAEYLNEATRDKMIDGWDCGDATEVDGNQWIFEGFVLKDPETNERPEIIVNVSGCADPNSTENDAARVQEIMQHLDDLRANHFD